MTRLILAIVAIALLVTSAGAQDKTNTKFGKGLINVSAKDSSWTAKVTTRIQSRYEGTYILNDDASFTGPHYTDRVFVRRARIKGSGYAYSPKLKYKFEYDIVNGFVLDAVLKWSFAKNWELWFGQTKLPGNIERVFSSQKLQLVDRSLLNSLFTLDRDAGLQLRHKDVIGDNFVIREKLSISQGEGLNQKGNSSGHDYTARVELLPFGDFTKKGDYFASDLKRESSPKLMVSGTYDFNVNALRSRGHKGNYLASAPRNLRTIFIDAHFKYAGFSAFAEFAKKNTTDGTPVVDGIFDPNGNTISVNETYYTGSAINLQLGYLFMNNWEIAGRYTTINPEAVTLNNKINQYTVGFSRYVVGHNLKVQADFSYNQEENTDDKLFFRFQTEFAF